MRTILDDLDREWQTTAGTRDAGAALRRWATTEAAVGHLGDLRQLVTYLHRRHPSALTDPIFAALLRQDDDLAHRTVLQALVPGLGAMATSLHRYGDFDETAAIVVAACWQRIRTYPVERRPRSIARYLLLDAKQGARRLMRDRSVFTDALSAPAEIAAPDGRPAAEELAELLGDARAMRLIDDEESRLIASTRIADRSFAELARGSGKSEAALRKQRSRAERRLRCARAA